jgi:two-component system NarL family sensor kinase
VLGTVAGTAATPDTGVGIDDAGARVTDVFPGSPAWRDGIRAGDAVANLRDSADPAGWAIRVAGRGLVIESAAVGHEARLRATIPLAVVGLGLVLVSLLLLARGSTFGLAAIPLGVCLSAWPLLLTGSPRDALVGGLGTFLLAGAGVALIDPKRAAGRVAAVLGISLAVLWTVSLAVPEAFDPVDAARVPTAAAFTLWGGWIGANRRRIAERLLAPGGPSAFDLVYLPGIVAILVGGVVFLQLAPVIAAIVLGVAVLAYPTTRRAAGSTVERLLVGNVRRQAGLQAIEEERGRLAREIHDAPLQELAAVIRRLEDVPGTAGETTALREVAAQLRDVATALHPPVLEDLGLAPALVDLGDALAMAHPDLVVRVEVDDLAAGGARPDRDAEVAAFRIAQEAAANAVQHSGGRALSIVGSVATDAIDLTVADDGTGIDTRAAAGARRKGHFGLDSMRDRAEAVGGVVAIASGASGVRIRFTWERPT